jgi:3-oxoacyl-[acyl-carrier-protein] synthase II
LLEDRIVITGMGAISPIGNSVEESWRNAINGVSGVGPITLFDTENFMVQIAAEIKNFKPEGYISLKEIRRRDRFEIFASIAAQEAIKQAGLVDLSSQKINPGRIGVVVSSAIGGLGSLHDAIYTVRDEGPRRLSPFVIPMLMANGASGMIAIDHGFKGPSMSVASACASGSDGIGVARMLLNTNSADVMITGGAEATITPVAVGAFDRLGAMSRKNGSSNGNYPTPSPFDRDRDGLVMGEGSAILVLEKESHARKRGIPILAEFSSYASSADAYHITAPSEDGAGGAKAMELALHEAKVTPESVDYINAHGTATVLNDLSETKAIKSFFKDYAFTVPISSTKSMTGHMMGATGALEAIFCILSIRDKIIPPTINYFYPDPECDLDYVPNHSREVNVQVAISNAFGFGGHNSVLVFKEYI